MKPDMQLERERFFGEEFMLWLWMRGQDSGGSSGEEGDNSACYLIDAITLVSEWTDVKEVNLNKGNPSESLEAFEALSRGMRPYRAKVLLLEGGSMEWTFTLSAENLEVSTMKLPPVKAKDLPGRLSDRLSLVEEGIAHLERRYAHFLNLRSEDPNGLETEMKNWIKAGLSQTDENG
jgi:hypothetical protein